MSSKRPTRNQKAPAQSSTSTAPTPTASHSIRSRPSNVSDGMWSPPTTNSDKDRLQREYGALYDSVSLLLDAVVAATESTQREAGIAFDGGLVSLPSFHCCIN
jgi:hypothetical protein